MIISWKEIRAAELVLLGTANRVDFIVSCEANGYFHGKITRNGILWKETEKVSTFKRALSDLLQLCYNEIGDENT